MLSLVIIHSQRTSGKFAGRYLLENDEERLNTTSFSDISGKAFDNLVIEFEAIHYIKDLQLTYVCESALCSLYRNV